MSKQAFEFRIESWMAWPLKVLLIGPKSQEILIDHANLKLRMGWAFQTTVPLTSIITARPVERRVYGWGVHGWRGKWLVNGSSSGLVEIHIDPAERAWSGPIPIKLRRLTVSVTEPEQFAAACSSPPT